MTDKRECKIKDKLLSDEPYVEKAITLYEGHLTEADHALLTAGADGNFVVTCLNPVAAFGCYGIDIGDFGGQLTVEQAGGTTQNFTVPNTFGSEGYPDGSVLFWGIIGQNSSETFTSAAFNTTTGEGDVFAFDDMTIGSFEQVNPNTPAPIPEPSALTMIVVSIVCLGLLCLVSQIAGSYKVFTPGIKER